LNNEHTVIRNVDAAAIRSYQAVAFSICCSLSLADFVTLASTILK